MRNWERDYRNLLPMWLAEKARADGLQADVEEDLRVMKRATDPDVVSLLYGLPRIVHSMKDG